MFWFRIFVLSAVMTALFAANSTTGRSQSDASIELHWRDCATVPPDDTSWYDHCHDGPWRSGAQGDYPVTFVEEQTADSFTGELDGNGDGVVSVPAGTYSFQHPPFHDAVANDFSCSYVDANGDVTEPVEDSAKITVNAGEHVVCDFYVVWDGGRAAPKPINADDPQGTIEIRWRACSAAADDEDWYNLCFDPESDLALEPQEGRLLAVRNSDSGVPRGGSLDSTGNVQIVVEPGNYTIPTMTGEFVTADYLYCSIVDEQGAAVQADVTTDPLTVEDGVHVICDYYYVAE